MNTEQSPSSFDSGNVIGLGEKIYIHYLDYKTVINVFIFKIDWCIEFCIF